MQDKAIIFRLSSELRTYFKQNAEKLHTSVSDLLITSTLQYLEKKTDSKDAKNILEEIQREKKLAHIRKQNTQEAYCAFFIRNCQRRLYFVAQSLYANNKGEFIDVKVLKILIKSMKNELNHLPKKFRILYKREFKNIEAWENIEFAKKRLEYMRALPKPIKAELLENK